MSGPMMLPVVTTSASSKTGVVEDFELPGTAVRLPEDNDAERKGGSLEGPASPRIPENYARKFFSKRRSDSRLSEGDGDWLDNPFVRNSTPFADGEWTKGWGLKEMHPVFANAEDLKERVRSHLLQPTYKVANFYKEEGIWQALARHPRFESLTFVVITMSALWVAIDTDNNDAELLSMAHPAFQVAEHFFCAFFFMEWLVRFMAFQHKRDGLKDGWFVFDSVLALVAVLETWLLTLVISVSREWEHLASHDSSALRLLRLLRLFRVARAARLLRAMPDLMILIKGLGVAIRSVFFTFALLLFIIYIFSIACTQLAADSIVGATHFNGVLSSMNTLFLRGALLDNISTLFAEVLSESYPVAFVLLVFILVAAITVMNMLIGVLCQVVTAVAAVEKEEMVVNMAKSKLESVVRTLDMDQDWLISKEEFEGLLESPSAAKALAEVGVDVVGLVDYADVIFENEAGNGFDKTLTFTSFVEIVLALRGSCTATVKDIVDLRKYMRHVTHRSESQLEQTSLRMTRIEEKLDKLLGFSRRRSKTNVSAKTQSTAASPQSAAGATAETYEEQASACARKFGSAESSDSLPGRTGSFASEMRDDSRGPHNSGSQICKAKSPAPVSNSPGNASSCCDHQEILALLAKLDKDAQSRFAELDRCLQTLTPSGQVQDLQRHVADSAATCTYSAETPAGIAQTSAHSVHERLVSRKLPAGSQSSTQGSFDVEHPLDSISNDGSRND